MRLIILDSDESYLQRIRVVLSSQMKEYLEVFTASTLKDLANLKQHIGLESYLLIHEEFIIELKHNDKYLELCQMTHLGFLSEGIVNSPELKEFLMKVNPGVSCIDIEKSIIMKYQPMTELVTSIKDNYLTNGQLSLSLNQRNTHLISLYHPYGSMTFSNWIETTLKKFPSQYKLLVIHYDPFYLSKTKTKFNLSYLFTLIKRGKKDLSLVINEMKETLAYNVDVIAGPGNMLDIDCLSEEEFKVYIHNLKKSLNYDIVIFNFNGVHITRHIANLLKSSKECILCHDEEDIQLSVMRQTTVTWIMMMNDLKIVLQEVIKKYGK